MEQLFLNGLQCDLSPGTVIALTLQINDIGGVADRQANFTNTFKLPFTTTNKDIFESAEIIQSATKRPYRKFTVQYFQGGAQIIHNGIAVHESSDDNFNITVYSGNKTFFDVLEGLKLSDLDLGDLDFVWNVDNAIAFATNTDGIIFPVVDYGNASFIDRRLDIRYSFPWIFFHTIIDRIVLQTGYTLQGEILDTTIYKNLIVSLPTLKQDISVLLAKARNDAQVIYPLPDLSQTVPLQFFPIVSDPLEGIVGNGVMEHANALYATATLGDFTQYNVLNTGVYSFRSIINYTIDGGINSATTFQIALLTAGVSEFFAESEIIAANSIIVTGSILLEATGISLTAGDIVVVRAVYGQSFGDAGNLINEVGSIFECVDSNKISTATVNYGHWFPVAINLPDLTQKDFIKIFLQMFGIFIQIDELTKVITLTQFKKIIENRNIARDWSMKRDVQQKPQIKYRIGNYTQVNWLRYKDDKTVTKYLGDGKFQIDDTTLKNSSDQFSLPFAATQMSKRFPSTVADPKGVMLDAPVDCRVTVDPDTLEVTIHEESSPRILILQKTDITPNEMFYVDDVDSVAQIFPENLAYFILPGKEFNLGFSDNLIEKNYTELTTSLDKCKFVSCFYKLNLNDVSDFDFSIPVYDSFFGHYFYVNRISQFIAGQLTQVELVRIKDFSDAISIDALADMCEGDGAIVISASGFDGGTWACYDSDGNVITGAVLEFGGDEYFDPSVTGVGTFTVKYFADDIITEVTITVHPMPTLSSFADVSQSDPAFVITGGSPGGGYYTVDGFEQTVFNPADYIVGVHVISYYSVYGCGTAQTITVTA